MFNPNPRVQEVAITPRHSCYVIDDALLEPQRWVEWARAHRDDFAEAGRNAFPGPELTLPEEATAQFAAFFDRHVRSLLGARRTLHATTRLSLVTRPPQELSPVQQLCHVDARELAPGELRAACVLYLFHAAALGGTAFYMPARPLPEVTALLHDAATLPAAEFSARHGLAPGYMTASNPWFRKVLGVPARWNRAVFYSGTVLHSGEIARPDLLTDDPATGRLTINGFLTCRRSLSVLPRAARAGAPAGD